MILSETHFKCLIREELSRFVRESSYLLEQGIETPRGTVDFATGQVTHPNLDHYVIIEDPNENEQDGLWCSEAGPNSGWYLRIETPAGQHSIWITKPEGKFEFNLSFKGTGENRTWSRSPGDAGASIESRTSNEIEEGGSTDSVWIYDKENPGESQWTLFSEDSEESAYEPFAIDAETIQSMRNQSKEFFDQIDINKVRAMLNAACPDEEDSPAAQDPEDYPALDQDDGEFEGKEGEWQFKVVVDEIVEELIALAAEESVDMTPDDVQDVTMTVIRGPGRSESEWTTKNFSFKLGDIATREGDAAFQNHPLVQQFIDWATE